MFLLAFGLRAVFLILMRLKAGGNFSNFVLAGDAFSYYNLALNLKYFFSLHVPSVPFVSDAFVRTPGYPFFLAAIFLLFKKSIVAVMLIQALLSGLTAILIYRISNLANFHRFVGLGAALIFCLEPMSIITSNSILTEALFLFLLLLFFYLLAAALRAKDFSKKKFLLLGVILGFDVLVRPVLYPYLIVIAFFLLFYFWREKIGVGRLVKTAAVLAVGIYLMVFPWILRNKIVSNSWSVSSIEGVHLFYSYAVPFYAYENHLANKDVALEQLSPKLNIVGDRYDLRNNQTYNKLAKEIIKQNPLGYVFFHLSHTVSFFMSNGYRNIGRELGFSFSTPPQNFSFMRLFLAGEVKSLMNFFRENISYLAVFIIGALIWLLINVFMTVGIIRGIFWEEDKTRKFFNLFFAVSILYFALTAGPEAYYKMRFPVNPFIFVLAFYGLFSCWLRMRSNKAVNEL